MEIKEILKRPKSERKKSRPCSPIIELFRRSSSVPRKCETESLEVVSVEEAEDTNALHNVGCPRFKAKSKSRQRLSSPNRQGPQHPRPWGARDPEDIPCFCNRLREGTDIRNNQVKDNDLMKRRSKIRMSFTKPDPHREIMDLFDEFCQEVQKRNVKLTKQELTNLSQKLIERLGKDKPKIVENTSKSSKTDRNLGISKKSKFSERRTPAEKTAKENCQLIVNPVKKSQVGSLVEPNNFLMDVSQGQDQAGFRQLLGTMIAPETAGYQLVTVKGGYYTAGGLLSGSIPIDASLDGHSILLKQGENLSASKMNPLFLANTQKLRATLSPKRK